MILDENLFEIKEARGSKEGVKRGPYNKEKSKSKEDLYDELQDRLEKEFYFPGVAKGGDLKVNLIMKDENKAELKGKKPARLIASSMSKYRDIKDEKELDTAKKIAKEMGFKTELDKTKRVPTLIIKLEESLNEKKSNRLTYHEFVDYLDSIDNGYTGFAKVTGNKGSSYRYTLSNKLTREQHDYLAQYDNVDFGTAQYKYAPEIKHDTVILLDRMSKTSPMKEDYDEDFFYTYEAIRHGESDPNRKYSGDFEDEEEAVELAKDDEYDEVVRYTYDFISDNFDDYWGMPPRRTDTIWTRKNGYLNEDIIKTSKGKWVNKGKEGTHGEFTTKKKAREQQKAMFAQGFKGESLKEEYGPHKNEPYCEEIADDLENGRWIGETYNGTSWELTINGYSSDEFSPAFAEYLAREVSYPVRDGHLSYRDLDLNINKHDLLGDSNKYISDLVKIGFDRETIDEWLKSPSQDEEIEIWVDYDLDFSVDDWKINESLDESIDRDSIESDFEDITNMSDARARLKKYDIDLIKKDNRNYILRKNGKEYTFYVLDNPNEVRKDLVKTVHKLIESIPRDYSFEYQLLDRLRSDCDYYLGAGGRSNKNLWAGSPEGQIAKMKELWNELPEKPEWLSMEDIKTYEKEMIGDDKVQSGNAGKMIDTKKTENGAKRLIDDLAGKNVTTGLSMDEIEKMKNAIYYKYYGDKLRIPGNLNKPWSDEDKKKMNELDFRDWVNSCLVYGETWKLKSEELEHSDILKEYNIDLSKALEIIEEQKVRFKKANVKHDVYTDSEGVSYNSVTWDAQENLKENIGSDIAEYQKWVDYDMKKYGRISSLTNHKVRKAGLRIVKDRYGDYEVIANEPIREDTDIQLIRKFYNEKIPKNKMELRHKLKDMGLEHGVSGVYSNDLEWVELNGKRYEIKKTNRGYSVNQINNIEEDLEREFTIHYNREGFEFGGYGAVRVKATNEDEAKEKFYAEKKDDKITISSIRPTENEDIRKGIRLLETKKVEESLKNNEVADFFDTAKKLGVKTLKDLKILLAQPESKGDSEKEKLDNYSKEANPDNRDLSEDVEVVDKNQAEIDKKAGLENLLNDLINDENEAINGYNSAIVNFELEGKSDLTNVFRDIIKDEQNHIGNLQKVLNEINPTTIANLEQGQEEAADTLNK